MYLHPATQANLESLRRRGVQVLDPGEGDLASHSEYGVGRLPEPAALLEAWEALLAPPTLAGLRVLVTAGGTREPIDSVRYIGNRSSGRMGFALAAEAARRGAQVTVVAAHTTLEPPAGVRTVSVSSAAELGDTCNDEFEGCDVLLMAAAVADFRPADPAQAKLKKDAGTPTIELEPTDDVLSALAQRRRPDQLIIGFAAEHGAGALEYGREKLERKRLDAIVVNDISGSLSAFDSPRNEVTIIAAGRELHVDRSSKQHVARVILDEVERLRGGKEQAGEAIQADGSAAPV
jgi:phosphopantothenoylcysteine decarboxylase/phosphopantothenate--cysteine ligase